MMISRTLILFACAAVVTSFLLRGPSSSADPRWGHGVGGPHSSPNVAITVGQVTGLLGQVAATDDAQAAPFEATSPASTGMQGSIEAMFGYWCKGKTCTGNQALISFDAYLEMSVERQIVGYDEDGNPIIDDAPYNIEAKTIVKDKIAKQDTADWNCPEGPPTWNAMATVVASDPILHDGTTPAQASSFTGVPQAGSAADAWSHTPNTNTTFTHQAPRPGFTDETGNPVNGTWNYDPNNPGTSRFLYVMNQVVSTFQGSAKEIDVRKSSLRATVRLEMQLN